MTSADAGQVNEIGYSENSFNFQLQLLHNKSFSKMKKGILRLENIYFYNYFFSD